MRFEFLTMLKMSMSSTLKVEAVLYF